MEIWLNLLLPHAVFNHLKDSKVIAVSYSTLRQVTRSYCRSLDTFYSIRLYTKSTVSSLSFGRQSQGKEETGGKPDTAIKMLLPNTSSTCLSVIHKEIRTQTKLLFCSRYTTEITEAQPTSTLLSNGLSETALLNSNTIHAKGRFAEANFLFHLSPPQSSLFFCWVQTDSTGPKMTFLS